MRALLLLRDGPNYRKEAFERGLKAAGFELVDRLDKPTAADIVVCWNRYGAAAEMADHVERHGGRAVIVENGWLGKAWRGLKWFTMTLGHCAGAGTWSDGGPSRWDGWGVSLAPFRAGGSEVVVLEQRGIGEPGIASPPNWTQQAARRTGGRIRTHPGKDAPALPIEQDLREARCVVTWHSAAAMQALMLGVPVFYECPSWLGREAGLPLSQWGVEPKRDEAARLTMFRRAAWCLWTLEEVESGGAIAHLVGR